MRKITGQKVKLANGKILENKTVYIEDDYSEPYIKLSGKTVEVIENHSAFDFHKWDEK